MDGFLEVFGAATYENMRLFGVSRVDVPARAYDSIPLLGEMFGHLSLVVVQKFRVGHHHNRQSHFPGI